jgi:hypothetical protein
MYAPYEFATSESVSRNNFIGCGNSSNDALRNTVVVCRECIARTIVFNIRKLASAVAYTATLWVNGAPTGLTATIADGSVSIAAQGLGFVPLNPMDLITVQLTYNVPDGALAKGMCATVCVTYL